MDNTEEKLISIPEKVYQGLLDAEMMLMALNGAGVDNWDGYDYAIEMYEEMKNNSKQINNE